MYTHGEFVSVRVTVDNNTRFALKFIKLKCMFNFQSYLDANQEMKLTYHTDPLYASSNVAGRLCAIRFVFLENIARLSCFQVCLYSLVSINIIRLVWLTPK